LFQRLSDSELAIRQSYGKTILSCPMCNSHEWGDYSVVAFGSQAHGGVPHFAVLRCRRHGVEFADAFPAAAEPASEEASGDVESLTALYGDDPNRTFPRYVQFMDRVEAIVGPGSGAVLHDVGCGMGHLLFEARRRGWRVQGSDIAPGVKLGIERQGVNCYIGSLSNLRIPSESCDVVTSFCVFPHHLAESRPDMVAVARMLKPGGWFVLQFPDNGPFRKTTKLMYRVLGDSRISNRIVANVYGPGGHQFAYTRKNLGEYLAMCGFKSIVFQSYSGSPKCALTRFRQKPLWYRASAAIVVHGLKVIGEVFRIPNHSIAFARK
jgi:SAM-dependent methyltransferase